MKVIQLIDGYNKGDGVGNVVTAIDRLLKANGFDTTIVNRLLRTDDIDSEIFDEDCTVLYHVSVNVDPLVSYLKCRKVMIFHNITTPDLLIGAGLNQIRKMCSAGLYDIRNISEYFDAAIVFSSYSKKVLIESGWNEQTIYQIPIMVRLDNFKQKYDEELVREYKDGKTNVIFTGRVFPHKRQEDIIYTFAEYKKKHNDKSRLFIVGGIGSVKYYNALKQIVEELKLEEDVIFTGKVSFEQYIAYYKLADLFLCMSSHEGFCIPIVEALYFDIPILAINSTAIPDTLGGSGVLLESRDERVNAELMNKILTDEAYRSRILEGERKRIDELMPINLEKKYLDILKNIILKKESFSKYKKIERNRVFIDGIVIPESLKDRPLVVYGYGRDGNSLIGYLRRDNIKIKCICDQNKNGIEDDGVAVLKPNDAFVKYAECNYIISIQDKKIIKDVILKMVNAGISLNKIYIFDSTKEEIF